MAGYAKSLIFVGSSLFLIRRVICLWTNLIKYEGISAVFTGFLTGIPLMLESPGRQIEISLYTLDKGANMIYLILERRYPWIKVKHGEVLLFGLSASILTFFYQNDKELFRGSYQKVMDLILNDV